SEEVKLHGALEVLDGLRFYGADLNDAGVVHQHIDAAEMRDGLANQALALCAHQLGAIAGCQDQPDRFAGKARGDSEAQAARAAGNDDHSIVWNRLTAQRTGDQHGGANGSHRSGDGNAGGCSRDSSGREEDRFAREWQRREPHSEVGCTRIPPRGILLADSRLRLGSSMATKRKSRGAYM